MARATRPRGAATRSTIVTTATQQVSVWEDGPEPAVQVTRPLPDPSKRPLAYSFSGRAPAPGGQPGTASFRYWTAAEALRRSADFWPPRLPSGNWEVGARLPVLLDQGVDYNGIGGLEARLEHGHRLRTHELVSERGGVRLRRRLFDCGLQHR